MTLNGIDVSQYQATTPPLGTLAFLVARASVGLTKDSMYDTHVANARSAGKAVGAYHFNWTESDPATQARFFLSVASNADFLALDVEGAHAFTTAQAQAFIAEIHKAGRKIGLYMSDSVFKSVGQDWNWVAKWGGTPPARQWTFWQYEGSPLDRDKFAGTDLQAFIAAQKGQDVLAVIAITPLPAPNPRTWHAAAGTVIRGYDPARPGVVTFEGMVPAGGATGTADATAIISWPGDATPPVPNGGPFIHVVSGLGAGLAQQWVREGLTLDPPATPLDLDAAYASGFNAAKSKAVTAVSNVS